MTSFIIPNVIELRSFQLSVCTWCYDVIRGRMDVFFLSLYQSWNAFLHWLCDWPVEPNTNEWYFQQIGSYRIVSDPIRFNPSEIWMSHRNANSSVLFSFLLSIEILHEAVVKMSAKIEDFVEMFATRWSNVPCRAVGVEYSVKRERNVTYKCEKLVFTLEPALD